MTQSHTHDKWTGSNWHRAMSLAHAAPRCSARCKHTKAPCRSPAVNGRTVCRMHGGRAGAPRGEANGAYRHGRHTKEAKAQRLRLRSERVRLAEMLRIFDASDGSEADLTEKMKAAGLL
jgi:hypothetical protein